MSLRDLEIFFFGTAIIILLKNYVRSFYTNTATFSRRCAIKKSFLADFFRRSGEANDKANLPGGINDPRRKQRGIEFAHPFFLRRKWRGIQPLEIYVPYAKNFL
ncbi:MAG: hypothetical protein LBL99_04430 [Holosporaceae bacterium]|jgi:hypothetical protein|nr:hypothetical protein [Holosporaceae bacterium]